MFAESRYRPWYPKAVDVLEDDWERMVAFYDFPEDHWKHLRTTNVVESPFAAVRLRTTAAKRFKRVESATALIWKLLLVAEKRFRGSTLLTSSRTCLKEGSSKTESPSQPNSGRMPPGAFTGLWYPNLTWTYSRCLNPGSVMVAIATTSAERSL